jgi:outer membrane protein assembly factor BamB
LLAFRPARDGQSPEQSWMAAGRVQSPRAQDAVMDGGALLADLLGDGCLEVVAAASSPTEGCARLVAISPDGVELWHHDFPRFPGPVPPWNVGGLTYFFAGRFTDSQRCDVLVSLRRTSMHSDESFMLDGRTGDVIWHRTEGPCGLGCGGGWTAVYDYDGDGLDDAFSFYPHVAWAMHGPTGNLLLGEMAQTIFKCSAYYAKPVIARPDGDQSCILFAGTAYVLGLLDHDMNVLWQSLPADGTPAIMQAIGDIDGDGRLELLAPGYRRETDSTEQVFCCHDLASGQLRWRLNLPGSCFVGNNQGFPDSPTAPAVADLDGDGRDECVFAIDDTLYAVGTDAGGVAGEVCWTLKLPARLGSPTIADVEASGKLQVIVACADGFVYGIGPASREPSG